MDEIEKLFKKISEKERRKLLEIIDCLQDKNCENNLSIIKVKNIDFSRLKKGNFRIIFHYEGSEVIIDSIRIRNEKTYKNL